MNKKTKTTVCFWACKGKAASTMHMYPNTKLGWRKYNTRDYWMLKICPKGKLWWLCTVESGKNYCVAYCGALIFPLLLNINVLAGSFKFIFHPTGNQLLGSLLSFFHTWHKYFFCLKRSNEVEMLESSFNQQN